MTRREFAALSVVAALVAGLAWYLLQDAATGMTPNSSVRQRESSPPPSGLAAGPTGNRPGAKSATGDRGAASTEPADGVTRARPAFAGITVDEAGRALKGVVVAELRRSSGAAAGDRAPPATSGADGKFELADSPSKPDWLTCRARVAGRALVGSEAVVERGKGARLVFVPACVLRVRVLDDATGVAVAGASVRAVTGRWVYAAWSNDLDAPVAELLSAELADPSCQQLAVAGQANYEPQSAVVGPTDPLDECLLVRHRRVIWPARRQ